MGLNGVGTVGAGLTKLATTGPSGVALVNGTGPLLLATTPNDGNNHLVVVAMKMVVSSAETGGAVGVSVTESGGSADTVAGFAAALGAGTYHWPATTFQAIMCGPNCAISINQSSALSAGASVVIGDIWSS